MTPSTERGRLLLTALALLAGNALYSLAVVLFLMPAGLITGGATGIALAANRLTGLPVSGVLLAVNVVMLAAGWALLGRRFALSNRDPGGRLHRRHGHPAAGAAKIFPHPGGGQHDRL